MLILVHCLSLLIFQLLKHRKRIKYLQSIENNIKMAEHQALVAESNKVDLEYNLKFDPPVYRQRYAKVYETLIDERWRKQIKKLCDFGCAEFGLFMFIKQLSSLNDIHFIDIDEETLRYNLRKIYPLTIEYLKRREEPLEVNIFAGSVADPDYRLSNMDAVIAVELIEHLYPDALDALPYNIFGFIEPKIVIITTPNADFNVLFSSDTKRMRHYDHKFEWTREQFSQCFSEISEIIHILEDHSSPQQEQQTEQPGATTTIQPSVAHYTKTAQPAVAQPISSKPINTATRPNTTQRVTRPSNVFGDLDKDLDIILRGCAAN
ncbi:unnamed protein product [Phaedon cochleariae]|uniref:Small RNA 2'-O-methyltransferase n=1 Tax=Phaedon cochleariae TaxID=80249 RepID=A0A9N9WZW9_PHACE|nr:unnamed protein product [Phaedon cochleariae]